MATANTKATAVTNADATPPKMNALGIAGGRLRTLVGTVEVAAADDDNSVYRFARVHSSWRISAIELFNDAITAGTAYHVGIHETAENGAAAVDADVFATSVDLSSARVAPLDVTFEALDIAKIEKPLWEVLGLTSDPNKYYDLTMTGATVGTAAGTISIRVRYSDGT